jgi:hypothetical protein
MSQKTVSSRGPRRADILAVWEAHEATKRAEAAILAHEREAATVLVALIWFWLGVCVC